MSVADYSNEHKFVSLTENRGEDENQPEITCDDAVEKIGFGKMQMILCVLCGMLWSADAMEMMLMSFLLPAAAEQWNLTIVQQQSIGSIVFVGMFFGSITWGLISDRFGRKIVFALATSITGIFGLLSAFSPNYACLLILRGIVGFGVGGAHVAFSLFAEFLPQKNKGKLLIMFEIFWSVGTIAEAALAWAVMPHLGWRYLLVFSSFPVLCLLACYPWLPESPRYLLVSNEPKKALEVLEKAARLNNTELPPGRLVVQSSHDNKLSFYKRLWQLLANKMYRVTLFMWIIWYACNFVYYGLVLVVPNLYAAETTNPNQVFLGILISSLAEIPGLFIACFGVDRLGRKKTLALMFVGCSAAMLILFINELFTNKIYALLIIMSILSRMFIMGSFSSVYVYTQEIYPTMVRSTGLGVCSSVSRIAGVTTPYVYAFGGLKGTLAVYAGVVFLAGVASLLLPFETSGQPTREVLEKDNSDDYKSINAPKDEMNSLLSNEF